MKSSDKDIYHDGTYIGFRGDDGRLFLQRCPSCKLENYAMAVAAGVCAWCGWKEENGKEESSEKEAKLKKAWLDEKDPLDKHRVIRVREVK